MDVAAKSEVGRGLIQLIKPIQDNKLAQREKWNKSTSQQID